MADEVSMALAELVRKAEANGDVDFLYETIRGWHAKFGPTDAAGLRCRRAGTSDKRHLDEV